jgi:LuxR family transcriptional regulator, activator of tox operons
MEVAPLALARRDESPIRAAIAPVIDAIGTADFDHQFFQVMRSAVRCEHFNAFVYSSDSEPLIVSAGSHGDPGLARRVGEIYMANFWKRDPLNQVLSTSRSLNDGITVRVNMDELRSSPHRRECYARFDWKGIGAKLIDRFSIVKRHRSEIFRVNFYRHVDDGLFTARNLTEIVRSADIIFSLLGKHKPDRALKNVKEARHRYEQQLRAVAPSLPSREIQVCTGIALGMTSEAIGSALGISTHTVLTYRKRAYARMQICSQNELLRLMFSTRV